MTSQNPFSYSGHVTGEAFCNREDEKKSLSNAIRNSQNILLYSHRRTGKTSLIHQVIDKLGKEKPPIQTAYIDLYGTLVENDFIRTVFAAVTRIESRIERLIKLARGIKITLSTDPVSGTPTVTPTFGHRDTPEYLEKVMSILQTCSIKRKLLVVFDEFQEIAGYKEEGFQKRLRKEIQTHSNIGYVFAGSQSHILRNMFTNSGKAFYLLARSLPLKPISPGHYKRWAQKLFRQKKMIVSDDIILEIVTRCESQPLYIQQFLYELWDSERPDMDEVHRIEKLILTEREKEFIERWDTLTLNQKKTLRLIINTGGRNLFTADSLLSVGFQSPSVVNRALDSLLKRELIHKNGNYHIQDVMFKKWIAYISVPWVAA